MRANLRTIPILVLAVFCIFDTCVSVAQDVKSKAMASVANPLTVTIAGVEFRPRSVTMAHGTGAYAEVRVTITATNHNTNAVGLYLDAMHTSVATDTGITIAANNTGMRASGIGICFADHDTCLKQADRLIVSLPPNVPDHMIWNLYQFPDQASVKTDLQRTSSIDISAVVYCRSDNGEIASYPVTFFDVPLQSNTFR